MTTADLGTTGVRRAWGWVAALRGGSATPWSHWHDEADPGAGPLPGAQQLELLRRLNLIAPGGLSGGLPGGLADRVLAAALPGRGRTDLALPGVGEPPRFGPAPVEPADLTDDELLRLACGLLAEDLAALEPADLTPEPVRRRRPWAPSYRLAGAPWLLRPMRADLRRRGRPEQHHPEHVYVIGTDLATMLADAWVTRAFAESGAGWSAWLGNFVATDRLPHRADLVAPARLWAGRIGRDRVTVVLDPVLLPRRLRLRAGLAEPPVVTAEGADLVRRVGVTLGILRGPAERSRLLHRALLPRLPHDPAAAVAVPAQWHGWVRDHAADMQARLRADGYPVLGDLDRLTPTGPADGGDPATAEVLGLALRLLLDPVASPGAAKEET